MPIAKSDMLEAVKYIADELKNPVAAQNLADDFISSAERLCEFPYANNVYLPIKPLESEYRRIIVKNYLMFYTVDEQNKTVTIMRVIYARRDMESQL
ncbi:MAG: type II toxin-antitoxin system RelE/ParE family toxin [Eubacterium sp.]|nr:type II toxin-antitoxin system RelE/ParE family toxin [Eubacterium sp.]MBR4241453.1 type II toxin-antitoxin system RelE/ParE family toxin [Eubacterium sp.]